MDPAAGRAEQVSARTAAVIKTKKKVITYDDLQLDWRSHEIYQYAAGPPVPTPMEKVTRIPPIE